MAATELVAGGMPRGQACTCTRRPAVQVATAHRARDALTTHHMDTIGPTRPIEPGVPRQQDLGTRQRPGLCTRTAEGRAQSRATPCLQHATAAARTPQRVHTGRRWTCGLPTSCVDWHRRGRRLRCWMPYSSTAQPHTGPWKVRAACANWMGVDVLRGSVYVLTRVCVHSLPALCPHRGCGAAHLSWDEWCELCNRASLRQAQVSAFATPSCPTATSTWW